MTTTTFPTAKNFAKLFNFNLQPRAIKFVNGIAVNISGSTCKNELEVSNTHVLISTYSVDSQSTIMTTINAPFVVKY